jgi:hypothetical protein
VLHGYAAVAARGVEVAVSKSSIGCGTLAVALVFASASIGAAAQNHMSGTMALRCTGKLTAHDVTNGGVAAKGRCTASGAIIDRGTFTDYRSTKGSLIKIRRVFVGIKGTISFVITIKPYFSSRWVIVSSTRGYLGLHGSGSENSDLNSTPPRFNLIGTVAR